jgi:hypothetical protein
MLLLFLPNENLAIERSELIFRTAAVDSSVESFVKPDVIPAVGVPV